MISRNILNQKILIILILSFLFKIEIGFAQKTNFKNPEKYGWLSFGLGAGGGGIAGGLNLSYLKNNHYFSLRNVVVSHLTLYGSQEVTESAGDVSFLYGSCKRNKNTFSSVGFGLGIVTGTAERDYFEDGLEEITEHGKERRYRVIGIPFEVQFRINIFSFIGIGLYGFGNVNKEKSYAGVLVCLYLGKL